MTTLKKIDFGNNRDGSNPRDSQGNLVPGQFGKGSVERSARSHLSVDVSEPPSASSVSS